MPDDRVRQAQQARNDELKFITKRLTPENPQDRYYINYEETKKSYYWMILIGSIMVLYFVFG